MAHHGVLFLDEFPEFSRAALESLRQPLEDGLVTIARAKCTTTFPASFMLIAPMNPCPCGYYTPPPRPCKCTPLPIDRYLAPLPGPLPAPIARVRCGLFPWPLCTKLLRIGAVSRHWLGMV